MNGKLWGITLVVLGLGCAEEQSSSPGAPGAPVGQATQAALVGESCASDTDCLSDVANSVCVGGGAGGAGGASGTCECAPCYLWNGSACVLNTCASADGVCADVQCNPATNACDIIVPVAGSNGKGCDPTTGDYSCSGGICNGGVCEAGVTKATSCGADAHRCQTSACNAATGECDVAPAHEGEGCNAGPSPTAGCTGICVSGACDTSRSMIQECFDRPTADAPCTRMECETASGPNQGTCIQVIRVGQSCNDGAACTSNDTCDASGKCRAVTTNDAACADGRPICGSPECRAETDSTPAGCYYSPLPASPPVECSPADFGACKVSVMCNGTSSSCPTDPGVVNAPDGSVCDTTPTSCDTSAARTGLITNQRTCSGGVCQIPTQTSCAPFNCSATGGPGGGPSCLTACTNDNQCAASAYCTGSVCVPKHPQGNMCSSDNQCQTGRCSPDGVCCDTACTGRCETCDAPGNVGTCVARAAGEQPDAPRQACTQHAICGGACNGSNRTSCSYPSAATVCVTSECSTVDGEDFFRSAKNCNGSGVCVSESEPPATCGGLICLDDDSGCLGGCLDDTDCTVGFYCPAAGSGCAPFKEQGEACTRAGECQSGNCVDGVCCDSGCEGLCEACNVAGSEGTCSPAPAGAQPVGARPDCAGTGSCRGSCDGAQRFACTFPGPSETCGAASCSGTQAQPAGVCNGAGLCATPAPVDCAPGACAGGICDGDCGACTADQFCVASRCVDKLTNGAACVSGSDCQSGNCVDGVCCDSACNGQCEACDVTGSLGVCSAVAPGEAPHGARTACATDGSSCGGTCDGTLRTSCSYPGSTEECRAASCAASGLRSLATLAGSCQGNGSCSAPQTQVCPGVCDGTICAGGCTDDAGCAPTEFCSAGVCSTKLDNGRACSSNAQCASDVCVDGVCCDTTCTGNCQECSSGTCVNRVGAPLPGRTPCLGTGPCAGVCTGLAPDCSNPGAAVACGSPSCVAGYAVPASTCDGQGACSPVAGEVCPDGLLCAGGACAASCTSDGDCAGELVCEDGACVEPPAPATGGTGPGGAPGVGGAPQGTGGILSGTGGFPSTGGGGTDNPDLIPGRDEGTCGCSVPGRSPSSPWALGLVAAGLVFFRWRSRSSSPRGTRPGSTMVA